MYYVLCFRKRHVLGSGATSETNVSGEAWLRFVAKHCLRMIYSELRRVYVNAASLRTRTALTLGLWNSL